MAIYLNLIWIGFILGVFGATSLFVFLIIYAGIRSKNKKGS